MPAPEPAQPPDRIRIGAPAPMIDCGRYPAKRTVGEVAAVGADIFRDGHDVLRAVVRYRPPGSSSWHETPMRRVDAELDGDRWEGRLELDRSGRYSWTIEAWTDAFATWRGEIERKIAAGQDDLSGELSEGVVLLEQAAGRASGGPAKQLVEQAASLLGNVAAPAGARRDAALDSTLADVAQRLADRSHATRLDQTLQIDVDRQRARFGSWYELFPRSWGGLAGVAEQIPELAELGFDVLYLPPVHPIGRTNRKGANNALVAEAGDPGSPWAIGDESGGHTALHAELGTFEDFAALVATAGAHGMEIALDFAIQCSADHPWLSEHPEWFHRRPDGTLKYAENPPKTYQDIYNLNFDCEDWRGLWDALAEVVLFWCERGVTIFRVDNPHTKPLAFWEWLIARTREKHPDTLFLAEAFTRAAMMRQLAKVGFNQSYTYFTWKSSKHDLVEYVSELAFGGMQDYYRPNFFVNTPDILTDELQHGGPPKFASRLVLAATLSPTYGIYSGFESFERVPVRAGSEEYDNSEKYEIKQRRLDGPLLALVSRMNAIRRANPALQQLDNIRFLSTENDALIAYVKRTADNALIAVVTLDPVLAQEGVVVVPAGLGLAPVFTVTDLLSGESFDWRIGRNYVRLDPYRVAHLLQVSG